MGAAFGFLMTAIRQLLSTMSWLATTIRHSPRRLRTKGILGINRRNAELILDCNPRSRFPIVDDKLQMRELCLKIQVPAPTVFASISSPGSLKRLDQFIGG